MNFLKRAIAYVKRRPAKSVLLMITFFLIGNLVILGLGVSQAATNAKTLTRKSMRAAVSYEVDWQGYQNYVDTLTDQDEINAAYENYPHLSSETAKKLAQDDRVIAYNYMSTNIMYSRGFDNVPLGNESQKGDNFYIDENGNQVTYQEPNIMVYGTNSTNMIEMQEGTYTLVDGRWYTQDDLDSAANVVCITQDLADQNGFKVGDTIELLSSSESDLKSQIGDNPDVTIDDFAMSLQIIGIYTTTQEVDSSSDNFRWASPYESPKNVVLVPFNTVVNFNVKQATINMKLHPDWYSDADSTDEDTLRESYSTPSTVVYLLDDPLNTDAFVSDHQADLADYTILNANDDAFKKMARPLDTLSFFSNILVWIVVINAVVIISLVTALTLKTREYEIGVLLSMGVSKGKVVLQLFVELFIIALIGFSLAVVSGSMIAGRVGDAVLQYQTATESQYADNTDDNNYYFSDTTNYFTNVTQDEMLSQYHVKVSAGLIGEIYVLGTAVVLVAIVIPSFMIMRLNPKQILLEQN